MLSIILLFQISLAQDMYQASETRQYSIVKKIKRPADLLFFTEGLSFYDENTLLESTGLYGDSEIHEIDNALSEDQASLKNRFQLDKKYFGEGSVRIPSKNGDLVYMLTYKERKAFALSDDLSEIKKEFTIPDDIEEGWGMTYYFKDEQPTLLISDGSSRIFHVNPEDFTIIKQVNVQNKQGVDVKNINELELYKDGSILANIYETCYIAKINPENGQLQEVWDFSALRDDVESLKGRGYTDPMFNKVMNGIAYRNDVLILGGKQWPFFYQIDMKEAEVQENTKEEENQESEDVNK